MWKLPATKTQLFELNPSSPHKRVVLLDVRTTACISSACAFASTLPPSMSSSKMRRSSVVGSGTSEKLNTVSGHKIYCPPLSPDVILEFNKMSVLRVVRSEYPTVNLSEGQTFGPVSFPATDTMQQQTRDMKRPLVVCSSRNHVPANDRFNLRRLSRPFDELVFSIVSCSIVDDDPLYLLFIVYVKDVESNNCVTRRLMMRALD
jgi:hypothetical protein